MSRSADKARKTRETEIEARVTLDASPGGEIATGIPFFDHMLEALQKHASLGLALRCDGDLEVDDHHSVEDCALVLGACIDEALSDRSGVTRFASAYAPLDEALVRCVLDLSGRPFAHVDLPLRRERIGTMSSENIPHFFRSIATSMRATLHLDCIRGENDHHIVEAAFKAFALALREAVRLRGDGVPSTKGSL